MARKTDIFIGISAAVAGFLILQQVAATKKVDALVSSDDTRVVAVETAELFKNIDDLEQEIQALREQKSKLAGSGQSSQQALQEDIAKLKVIDGRTAVQGEGIEITFDKQLVVSELTDLVNALRNIGAEAIAVNDRRTTAQSHFSLQDGKPTLVVKAIGKRELLKEAVSRLGGILQQIGHGSVTERESLTLPSAS